MTVKEQIKNALTMSWAKIKSLCVLNSNVVNSTSGTSTTYPLSAAAGADLQNQINELNSAMDKYIIIIDAESEKATIPPHQGKRFSAPKIIKEGYDFLGIINAFPNGDASIICYTSEWAYNVNDTSRTISVTYQLAFIKKL